jgi:hypothetical protein
MDNHFMFDGDGNLPDNDGGGNHYQREENQIVQNAIAHRFAKRIDGHDCGNVAHFTLPSIA